MLAHFIGDYLQLTAYDATIDICFLMNRNMGYIFNYDDRYGGIGHYCQYRGYFWVHTTYHSLPNNTMPTSNKPNTFKDHQPDSKHDL